MKAGEEGKSQSADVKERLSAGEKNRTLQEVVVQLRCFSFSFVKSKRAQNCHGLNKTRLFFHLRGGIGSSRGRN